MKPIRTLIRSMIIAALVVALAGCMSSSPQWDANFGNAVTQVRTMQVMNPNASSNDDPVAGLDGTSAGYAIENYGKSFDAPPPHMNVFSVGIGSSGTN